VSLAGVLVSAGRLQEAEEAAALSVDLLSELASRSRSYEDSKVRARLSEAHDVVGRIHTLSGRPDRAAASWRQALEVLEPVPAASSDRQVVAARARALLRLGPSAEASATIRRLTEMGYSYPELSALEAEVDASNAPAALVEAPRSTSRRTQG
jgi:hypothetical protein